MFAHLLSQARDIEVSVSSAQIVSAVGTCIVLLLIVIGWFARQLVAQGKETAKVLTAAMVELKVHAEVLSDLKQWRLQREDVHERRNEEQQRVLREEIARLKAQGGRE